MYGQVFRVFFPPTPAPILCIPFGTYLMQISAGDTQEEEYEGTFAKRKGSYLNSRRCSLVLLFRAAFIRLLPRSTQMLVTARRFQNA